MQRTLTAIGAFALVAAHAIAAPQAAHALPLAKAEVSLQRAVETIAQKKRDDDGTSRKSRRVDSKEDPKVRALRYGSTSPGTSIPLNARGANLYSPSFNGAYTPPSGYSFSGYPIHYADEVEAPKAECDALRRRAMESGKRSSWDRYHACTRD